VMLQALFLAGVAPERLANCIRIHRADPREAPRRHGTRPVRQAR
jgi:hypothetical protein